MSTDIHPPTAARDYWARYHVDQALKKTYNKLAPQLGSGPGGVPPLGDTDKLPSPPPLHLPPHHPKAPLKVCIIGAGAAGLFTALLIDHLNATVPTFNVQYDIFESQAAVGGRLYTYNFSSTPHDYYDVGAMRFPENDIMRRYVRARSSVVGG